MFKSKNLIIAGIILVAIGGFLKIMKVELSNILILTGIGIEILALITFIKERKAKKLTEQGI
tara:strand:+ start:1527 stop:1712 length:186 start_codon:yes stop_codon:yes gene_type:complete